jgi:hypothetical protein
MKVHHQKHILIHQKLKDRKKMSKIIEDMHKQTRISRSQKERKRTKPLKKRKSRSGRCVSQK